MKNKYLIISGIAILLLILGVIYFYTQKNANEDIISNSLQIE